MTDNTRREAVAKAIFEVLAAFEDSWDAVMQWRRESFLRAADAAINAMQLAPEWRGAYNTWHRGAGGKKVKTVEHIMAVDEKQAKQFAAQGDNWYAETRLASPWTTMKET